MSYMAGFSNRVAVFPSCSAAPRLALRRAASACSSAIHHTSNRTLDAGFSGWHSPRRRPQHRHLASRAHLQPAHGSRLLPRPLRHACAWATASSATSAFDYGPLMFLPAVWLRSCLHLTSGDAFYLWWVLNWVGGTALLWWTVQQLPAPPRHRTWIFSIGMALLLTCCRPVASTTHRSAIPLPAPQPWRCTALCGALFRSALALALLCEAVVMAYSPEQGISFALATVLFFAVCRPRQASHPSHGPLCRRICRRRRPCRTPRSAANHHRLRRRRLRPAPPLFDRHARARHAAATLRLRRHRRPLPGHTKPSGTLPHRHRSLRHPRRVRPRRRRPHLRQHHACRAGHAPGPLPHATRPLGWHRPRFAAGRACHLPSTSQRSVRCLRAARRGTSPGHAAPTRCIGRRPGHGARCSRTPAQRRLVRTKSQPQIFAPFGYSQPASQRVPLPISTGRLAGYGLVSERFPQAKIAELQQPQRHLPPLPPHFDQSCAVPTAVWLHDVLRLTLDGWYTPA